MNNGSAVYILVGEILAPPPRPPPPILIICFLKYWYTKYFFNTDVFAKLFRTPPFYLALTLCWIGLKQNYMYTCSIDINCYKVEMILSNWFNLFELAVGGLVILNMLRSLLLFSRIGSVCLRDFPSEIAEGKMESSQMKERFLYPTSVIVLIKEFI